MTAGLHRSRCSVVQAILNLDDGWLAGTTASVRSRGSLFPVNQETDSWNTLPVAVMSPWTNMTGSARSAPSFSETVFGLVVLVYQLP